MDQNNDINEQAFLKASSPGSRWPGPDINCDMGEGSGHDAGIMPYISSASIACGFHAGDEETMKHTVELAMKHRVLIGAHPSFADRENFGRNEIRLPLNEVYDLVTEQVHRLGKIARAAGTSLHHVKPHGALYNMAAREKPLAAVIARAIKDVDEHLKIYGLCNSHLTEEAENTGIKAVSEVFADRSYQDNGMLTPRSGKDALINDTGKVVMQVLQMVEHGTVTAVSGKVIPVKAETICIHGDGEKAVDFAKAIYDAIIRKG
jgi:UPF0271 protein